MVTLSYFHKSIPHPASVLASTVSFPPLPGNPEQVAVPESPYNPIFSPNPWIVSATLLIPFGHFVASGVKSPLTRVLWLQVSSILMYWYPTAFNPRLTNALAAARAVAAEEPGGYVST